MRHLVLVLLLPLALAIPETRKQDSGVQELDVQEQWDFYPPDPRQYAADPKRASKYAEAAEVACKSKCMPSTGTEAKAIKEKYANVGECLDDCKATIGCPYCPHCEQCIGKCILAQVRSARMHEEVVIS